MSKKTIWIIVIAIAVLGVSAFILFHRNSVKAGAGQYYDLQGNQIDPTTGAIIKTAAQIAAGK